MLQSQSNKIKRTFKKKETEAKVSEKKFRPSVREKISQFKALIVFQLAGEHLSSGNDLT